VRVWLTRFGDEIFPFCANPIRSAHYYIFEQRTGQKSRHVPPPCHRITIMAPVPRYARIPLGTLFPFHPVTEESLSDDTSTTYTLSRTGNTVSIYFEETIHPKSRGTYAAVPLRYETLVRRFLYRGEVLKLVLTAKDNEAILSADMKQNIRANLWHFFRVLDQCKEAFTAAARQADNVNIPFFDSYMVQENFVGRHEPAALIDWQRDHPQCNLRTQDVFSLGGFSSHCESRQ